MRKSFVFGLIAMMFAGTRLMAQEPAESSYDLDEVVVIATRMNIPLKNIPQKVEIIDRKKIETVPADNVADLLKTVTNIDILQYPGLSASIGMRGFSPSAHSRSYSLLLIDGMPSGTTNLATIPTSMIERIEIVKGPYSLLYGSDAMGGVVNLITKKVTGEGKGYLSAHGGSFGQFQFSEYANVPMNNRFSFAIGLSRKVQSDDYRIGNRNLLRVNEKEKLILDKESYGATMTNSKYYANQVSAKMNYLISSDWSASLGSFFTLSRDVETPGNYWHTYTDSKKNQGRVNMMGQIKREKGKHLLTVSPYFSNDRESFYSDLTNAGFVNLIATTREYGIKTSNTLPFGNNLALLTGIDYDVYDYLSERFKASNTPDVPYQPDNRNQKLSALAQLSYHTGRLSANAGVRYNYIIYGISENDELQTNGVTRHYSNFNPSIGLQLHITDEVKLHGSYGSAFSVPDAFKIAGDYKIETYFPEWDFWWRQVYVGNPDLKPEASDTYDVGISYNSKGFSLDVTYFNSHHSNKIVKDLDMADDTVRYINSDRAFMDGLELLGSVDLAALSGYDSKLELYGGFTFLFNSHFNGRKNETDATLVTRDLLGVRKTNGNFGVFFDTNDKFSTRLHARFIGKRLEYDEFSELRAEIKENDYYTNGGYEAANKILQLSAHLVFDWSAYYNLTSQFRVGVSVSNLLDENYTEKDGYNMPGRSILGSLTYSF